MDWNTQTDLEQFDEADGELRRLLMELRDNARQATELPESFWQRQRVGIRAAIATHPIRIPIATLAWGLVLVVLIMAMLLADVHRSGQSQQDQRAEAISDQQLLMKVQYTVQNDVPIALEPAALLAREIETTGRDSRHSEGD